MGYQLIYNSSFKDIDENTINIEIYRDSGGTLIASELLCSADAVSINYESDDDVFKPIKCSDCQINVLTTKVLANLYTALGNQIYCTISKNGSLLWCGYLWGTKRNVYIGGEPKTSEWTMDKAFGAVLLKKAS